MIEHQNSPDYLMEVSWEVCNKIGKVHNVITSKASEFSDALEDRYVLVGPDVWRSSSEHPEFIEDSSLYADWKMEAEANGLHIRTGRWNIQGNPNVVLVDFTPYFNQKDDIFKSFWDEYKLDSITGQWDYIEPMLFGYAAGKVIESFIDFHALKFRNVVAQFHDWMTASGLLYVKQYQPQVGTVFTIHGTVIGNSLAEIGESFNSQADGINPDEIARRLNIVAKQSVEKITANVSDVFTTISDKEAEDSKFLLGKEADFIAKDGYVAKDADKISSDYWAAFILAVERSGTAVEDYGSLERVVQLPPTKKLLTDVTPQWRKLDVQQQIPEKLHFLEELARNIWWSWTKEAVDLFRSIDEELWTEVEENPIILLEKVSFERLKNLESDQNFMENLSKVETLYRQYMELPRRKNAPSIAYYSMEFGLHNSLKIYSGGLGLLAGDYLKEASDYNYDMIGVGLLYRYGYFRQAITSDGVQMAYEDYQDFSRIPVTPVKDEHGNWKKVHVILPGRPMYARIWKVQVGRISLYLLDADIEENREGDREVTHRLYGGDNENRFKQELLLGIGGVRALRELGIHTDLYHLNEGHAAFTGLERLREYIQQEKMTYPEAREVVRSTSLFTTHTPVPAGHDKFDENMMRTYLSHYPERLTIDWNRMMNLGRENHDDSNELFSMSVLAVNLSQEVNGVSKLHGAVSKEMFKRMWKGYMAEENHIGYVTNGVHLSTWLADSWRALYSEQFGADFLQRQEDRDMWKLINKVDDKKIWEIRNNERAGLIEYIRKRLSDASARFIEDPAQSMEISEQLNEKALTIGFARRFATYKRAHLLFNDLERLATIVNNSERPIQFVFAGKAHPKDEPGQALIKRIVEISKMPQFIGKIIFLQNYNILLAKQLLHGVDIWLNTPTRPLEASGTSGEKAVMNGGLHFSVLDGWWAEGYKENAGWALPIERTFENQTQQDKLDAERIYSLLENDITPKFYSRNSAGIPEEWIKIIKNSVTLVAPEFTMNRMFRDYEDRFYQKLYDRSRQIKKQDYRLMREIAFEKKQIMEQWKDIQVSDFNIPDPGRLDLKVGQRISGSISLHLNGLDPKFIGLEMVMAEHREGRGDPVIKEIVEMECKSYKDSKAEYILDSEVGTSGHFDIGFRIYAKMDNLPHRMDLPLVRWI